MKQLIIALCLVASFAQAQVSQRYAARIYRVGDQLVIADSLGSNQTIYPFTVAQIVATNSLVRVNISGLSKYYTPPKILNSSGVAYSTTSTTAAVAGILATVPDGTVPTSASQVGAVALADYAGDKTAADAKIDSKVATINTISSLSTLVRGGITSVNVLEARGGLFTYASSGYTADGAIVYAANGGGFWVRQMATPRIQAAWFGIYPSNADNTSLIESMMVAANRLKVGVEFDKGTYKAQYINLYAFVSIYGQGSSNTIFQSLISSETNFLRLASAPVTRTTYKGFQLAGVSTNPVQNGFGIIAIPQLVPSYTGGLWWSELSDIEIRGFKGNAIEMVAIDGAGDSEQRGDLANQWLVFTNVRAFRDNSTTSRCLRIYGQAGQITFNTCQFDGPVNGVPNTVNIEIGTYTTPTATDYAYAVDFYNCTIQNTDYGLTVDKAQHISITNSYFENNSRAVTATNNAYVLVSGTRFANSASGLTAGNTAGTGYLFGPNASMIDVRDYWKIGVVDKDFSATNPTGYSIPTVKAASTTTLFASTGIVPNRGVDGSGIVTTNYLHEALVNTNTTRTLVAINSQLATGDRITLRIFDALTSAQSIPNQTRALNYIILSTSGAARNITFPAWVGQDIVLRHGDAVTLQKTDINGSWIIVGFTLINRVNSTVPVGGLYVKGEHIYNTAPTAGGFMGWVCTQAGGSVSGAWTSGQTYTAFTYLSNGGKVYRLVTAGGGTATVSPTHSTGSVTGADGYVWNFEASALAIWKGFGLIEN